jgi:hypothetical protein
MCKSVVMLLLIEEYNWALSSHVSRKRDNRYYRNTLSIPQKRLFDKEESARRLERKAYLNQLSMLIKRQRYIDRSKTQYYRNKLMEILC